MLETGATRARLREPAEALLQHKIDGLEMILDCLGEGVIVADKHGAVVLFNPAAEAILGVGHTACSLEQWAAVYGIYKDDCATPCPLEEFPLFKAIHGTDNDEAVLFIKNAKLTRGRFIKVTGRPLRDARGIAQGGVVVFRDVTEAREAEEQLRKDAYHDSLTGIHNRSYLTRRLAECFSAAQRHGEQLSIGLCDLDRLKTVNDTCGHAAGDRAIRAFARMLDCEFRTEDLVARIGGDEFCVVFPRLAVDQAAECLERMRARYAARVFQNEDGSPFSLSCSAGVAGIAPGMTSHADMLISADMALYRAKKRGRNQVATHTA